MFEEINKIQEPQRKGLGKFLHNLAQRMSQPQKKVIMKWVREAEPKKKRDIQH
jgi:hypothetical protein